MDIEIKKDLASNWFRLLQNAICDDISRLEKNRVKFKLTSWKRNEKKDEGGGEYRIITIEMPDAQNLGSLLAPGIFF